MASLCSHCLSSAALLWLCSGGGAGCAPWLPEAAGGVHLLPPLFLHRSLHGCSVQAGSGWRRPLPRVPCASLPVLVGQRLGVEALSLCVCSPRVHVGSAWAGRPLCWWTWAGPWTALRERPLAFPVLRRDRSSHCWACWCGCAYLLQAPPLSCILSCTGPAPP